MPAGALREALADASRTQGRFEVWVTHMFVLSYLVGTNSGSGEGLVMQTHATSAPIVLARLTVD